MSMQLIITLKCVNEAYFVYVDVLKSELIICWFLVVAGDKKRGPCTYWESTVIFNNKLTYNSIDATMPPIVWSQYFLPKDLSPYNSLMKSRHYLQVTDEFCWNIKSLSRMIDSLRALTFFSATSIIVSCIFNLIWLIHHCVPENFHFTSFFVL